MEILRNSFKPYPCGIVIHPIIDGCSQLHVDLDEKSLKLEDIVSVYISVHPLVLEMTGKKNPQDSLEAKFSVYHGAAIGLIYGKGHRVDMKTPLYEKLTSCMWEMR